MDALTVKGLSKTYSSFTLQNISFQVPKGTIVGLVGENGAGKSTTINAVLGLIKKDSGDISILGRHDYEMTAADRELIGVVFDNSNFSGELSPKMLHKVLKDIYHTWDEALYFSLLEKMNLPRDKKIKTFSRGMKMKLSIIAAVSHHPHPLHLPRLRPPPPAEHGGAEVPADDDKSRLTPPGCIKADGEHIFHIPIKCRRYKTDISHLCPQPL